jgi:putative transcriptional regulator
MILLKNKIKELRSEHNLTQKAFADIVDVSRHTIIAIEKEVYDPSLKLAFKFSKYFSKTIEEIFEYEE